MYQCTDLIKLVASFEVYLGDPQKENSACTFQLSLELDEQEVLAWPQIKCIQQWGYMDYLIPPHLTGKLHSLDTPYLLAKSISRRDITTAIAINLPLLAALPLWMAGTVKQQQKLFALLKAGRIAACALTEEEHGSDIMANEVFAKPCPEGWELSGKKWCINFATEGQAITLLCRTHHQGGPLGFSVFHFDKAELECGFSPTPKLPTLGVRGLDISGFSLDKVIVPKEALIGEEKKGLELIYKTLQVTRTLCAAFAVGGADTALRFALDFSLQRQLYGNSAYQIPAVKQRLGEQFTLLLIADCTSLVLARAASVMPEKFSFWSAISKFLIPKLTEELVEECGLVMGARGYLRTTTWAMFQKIRRDIQVVGLFDGSSQVNLSLIAGNLVTQTRARGRCEAKQLAQLASIFNMQIPCAQFTMDKLCLFTYTEDAILAGLATLESEKINPLIQVLRAELARLDQKIMLLQAQKQLDPRGLAAFRLAEHYCWLFAASCCLHFWHFNEEMLTQAGINLDWLQLATQLILNRLQAPSNPDSQLQEAMANTLCTFYQEKKLFSVLPTQMI